MFNQGKPELEQTDIIVHGETIIQLKFSKEANELMDEMYNKVSNFQDLFVEYLRKDKEKKQSKIELVITKNPQLAEMVMKQIKQWVEKNP